MKIGHPILSNQPFTIPGVDVEKGIAMTGARPAAKVKELPEQGGA